MEDRASTEWYAEFRNQSFQGAGKKIEYARSRSQFDAHIADIRGTQAFDNLFWHLSPRLISQTKDMPLEFFKSQDAVNQSEKLQNNIINSIRMCMFISLLSCTLQLSRDDFGKFNCKNIFSLSYLDRSYNMILTFSLREAKLVETKILFYLLYEISSKM